VQASPRALPLAAQLRALREEHWPGVKITQGQLATAFSRERKVGVSSISSWESQKSPVVIPEEWLARYARFFATRRSVQGDVHRLLPESDLSPDELTAMEGIRADLVALRATVLGSPAARLQTEGPWVVKGTDQITIVCAALPDQLRAGMPYTDPNDPNYIELYTYADLDALLELHGHIRAVNPHAEVRVRTAKALVKDDVTSHLVLLGGVDWNLLTREVLRSRELPVTQESDDVQQDEARFVVRDGDKVVKKFGPEVHVDGDRVRLIEDVAHFYRGPNPFNRLRSVTICNGMYGRGVLGAVRALTDAKFRDRNAEYVRKFDPDAGYSILARVRIVAGDVVTPDWTDPHTRLHEWSASDA
jgi:hypothetical protein